MKHRKVMPLLAWLALVAPAVEAGADAPPPSAEKAQAAVSIDPVFDCYRANSAWGLSYAGTVVDRNGQIWSYSQRGKMLPVATKNQETIQFDAVELSAKYEGSTQASQIDAKLLADHSTLIDKAAAGKITRSDTGVRDAGSSSCHAYLFDTAKHRYRDVELGSDGAVSDQRISNDAPEARALIDWLRSIGVAK